MVALGFGFSLQDVVAVTVLIAKVIKALRKTDGAASQFQQALAELDAIQSSLTKVQSIKPTPRNANTLQLIQFSCNTCRTPLSCFVHKIERFEIHLGSDGLLPASMISTSFKGKLIRGVRKVEWAVFLQDDFTELKRSITPQLQVIGILIQQEVLDQATESHQLTHKTYEMTQKLQVSVAETKSTLGKLSMTEDQVTFALGLIESRSMQSAADSEQLLDISRTNECVLDSLQTQITMQQAQLVKQEALLTCIAHQIGIPMLCHPVAITTPSENYHELSTRTTVAKATTQTNGAESCIATTFPLSAVLLALRKEVTEVVIMFVCLFPTVRRLFHTRQAIPRSPSLLLPDNIELEDALGRTISLPYEHFRHWPLLQARLEVDFTGQPGEVEVKNRQFEILANDDLVLAENNWTQMIFPGAKVVISIEDNDPIYLSPYRCILCDTDDFRKRNMPWTQW